MPPRAEDERCVLTALVQITDGLVCKGVQMSGGNILLKLFVPRGGIEPGKPVAES